MIVNLMIQAGDWTLLTKRNIVNSEITLAKQAYYQNSFNEYMDDFRKTWQTINELTSQKSGKRSVTSVNGVSITNPTTLSNQFNNHFATIGLKLAKYRRHTDPNGGYDQNEIKRNKALTYFKQVV